MNKLELNMQLDPAVKVATWFSNEKDDQKRYGAAVIGTDGKYRFACPREFFETIEKLGENVEVDIIGISNYVLVFNSNNILNFKGDRYFVGSTFVVKMGETCLELVSEDEIDEIRELFGCRMVDLKIGCNQVCSAYELI